MTEDTNYLDTQQAARILGLSAKTLARYRVTGEGPVFHRFGKRICYLVDLLNAVAAITSGGAYVTLAQLAGVTGLGRVLFRTAFGGSWKDNAKLILLFATVWGAMIVPKATVRLVDRLDPTLAPAVVANVLCLPFISSGVHQERRPVRRHW